MTELGSAHGKIVIDASGVKAGVNAATASIGKIVASGAAILGTIKLLEGGIKAAGRMGIAAINMGSDAQETASLIRNSLGGAADDFAARISQVAASTERSRYEMAAGVSTTIAMTKAMGFGQQQAADYAVSVAQAGADLSSFFNVADSQVILDINSALAGSSEPMQKYGIDVRESALQAVALSNGLIEQGESMDRATRSTAVMLAVQEQAADAMGDAARTSDSFANQLRGLQGQIGDAGTEIGSKLVPQATEIISSFRKIVPGLAQMGAGIAAIFSNIVNLGVGFVKSLARALGVNFDTLSEDSGSWGQNIVVSLASGMAAAASAVIQVLNYIGNIISGWLKPGSPPKLLPNLDTWGASAMSVYMRGWADGDFSVFDDLAGTIESHLNSLGDDVPEQDLIPRIMGSRAAIGDAIEQMRQIGSVSQDALNRIWQTAGITDKNLQNYVVTMFDLQRANDAVVAAQDEVNRVTQKYDDLLTPLNDELSALKRQQEDSAGEQELAGIRKRLAEERLTDQEREQLQMQARQLEIEAQIRATEGERDAALDAANAKLDAATTERDSIAEQVSAQQQLLDIQNENNSMLAEQLDLLGGLEEMAAGAADALTGKLGGALAELPGLAETAMGGMAGAGDLFAGTFDTVFASVEEKFAPLQTQVEELGQTWATAFEGMGEWATGFFGEGGTWPGLVDQFQTIAHSQWGEGGTWQGIIDNAKTILDIAFNTDIAGYLDAMFVFWTEWLATLIDGPLGTDFSTALYAARDFVKEFKDKAVEFFTEFGDFVSEKIDQVKQAIENLLSAARGLKDWIENNVLDFHISVPALPDWATPGSPLPIHTAWKAFADEMNGMDIRPRVDMSQMKELIDISGSQTVNNSKTTSLAVNFYGNGNRIQDDQNVNTLRALAGGI